MSKFNSFNINAELALSFKEVFDNREANPPVNLGKCQSSVYPKEQLSFEDWKQYIHNELKKDLETS